MLISTKYPANGFLDTIVVIGIWFHYTFVFVSIFCTLFFHSLIVYNDHTFLYMQ
jgi:hypothetical protein